MSEQLPQNKNEQNDNSAFDPDLYQDFDAEAGLQADLAAFNSRLDEIKTEHDNRHDDAFNPAASAARKLQSIPREIIRTPDELRAMPVAEDPHKITMQAHTPEEPAPKPRSARQERKAAREKASQLNLIVADMQRDRAAKAQQEEATSEEAPTTQPEQTSTSSTPQQKQGITARAKAAIAARRENKERSRQTRAAFQETTGANPNLDDLVANPLPSTLRARAAEEAKAREAKEAAKPKAETPAATTSSEDQPGNVPAESKERRRHAAPKGKQAKVAAPVAAAAANTATAPAPAEPDSDSFFGSMTQNMTAEPLTVDRPQTAAEVDADLTQDFGDTTSNQSFAAHADQAMNLAPADTNLPPETTEEPFSPLSPEELRERANRRMSEPPRTPGQPFSPDTMFDLQSAGPIQMGIPYVNPNAPAPGYKGDDYDFDPQGNNTAAAPDTSANSDDAFAHLFRNPSGAPEAPTTYTTPLDVVATPGENTVTGRELVTDAMNRLGKNFETGYAYNNTAYFVHNRRTGENMVIHISDLDDPDYLKNQLEGIKDMNERGMTRSEKVAYKIGNLASRVANSDRMQKIESRWDKRRAGIQVGEGVMVDMTPDIEAMRGDRTRSDARRAEHIARKEERAEVRRQRLEDEPSFYKRHRKALVGTLSGLILADVIAGGIAANNAFNHDDHHNTAPRVSASPTPGASHSASPSARPSASPSASSSSEAASPSATTSPSAEAPSATPAPTSPTVNPNRPNAPEGGQGGSGVTTRNEQHAHENLTFITRDGKQQVTATLKEGGTIFEAGHDAGLTDTQIMNAVQRAGITEAQAASLTPNQIVDFTPSGNSYEVKLR